MNHRAKFDVASFILTGEICNCTKLQQKNKHNFVGKGSVAFGMGEWTTA